MPERMQFQQQNRNFGLYKGAKSSGYICPSCEPDRVGFFTPIPLIEKGDWCNHKASEGYEQAQYP